MYMLYPSRDAEAFSVRDQKQIKYLLPKKGNLFMLLRLLCLNPLLSLLVVLVYIIGCWFAAAAIFTTLGGWYTLGFVLLMSGIGNLFSPLLMTHVKMNARWRKDENTSVHKDGDS